MNLMKEIKWCWKLEDRIASGKPMATEGRPKKKCVNALKD